MLKYFDTNIFIYSFLDQGKDKQEISSVLINNSITNNELIISTLVLQELVYALAKNNVDKFIIKGYYDKLKPFVINNICKVIFEEAILLSMKLDYFQNINDCIHIKFAERHCEKLITFDKDYEKFKRSTKLEIEILN